MRRRARTACCLGTCVLVLTGLLEAQTKPLSTAVATDLADGKRVFDAQCAWCHGTDGAGGAGPSLQRVDLRNAGTDADLVTILRNGIPGTEMPGFAWSMTDTMTTRPDASARQPMSQKLVCATCLIAGSVDPTSRTNVAPA